MKQNLIILIISTVFVFATASGGMAEDMSQSTGHKMSMKKMDHGTHQMVSGKDGGMMDMDHSGHSGKNIHNSVVDGYRFSYNLIDIREKMAAMKAEGHMHEGMDATHHLMVYIKDPDGVMVENAKVGYLVKGSDGPTRKHMCMGMGGGYGSDLNLEGSDSFTIKTKAVVNGKNLIDDFKYTVE